MQRLHFEAFSSGAHKQYCSYAAASLPQEQNLNFIRLRKASDAILV